MTTTTKLTSEQFVLKAVATESMHWGNSKGIHSVFSGFNEAYRKYFNGADPVKAVIELVTAKIVETKPSRGGSMIYKHGESPRAPAKDALKAMGLE